MPSAEERLRRKTIVQALKDKEVAALKSKSDASRASSAGWWDAVQYADALYNARRFKEALQVYGQALSMCPGEFGTQGIEKRCEQRVAECRRRKSVR
jgi:tetratricopeptide (TPR) repeat protein